MGGGRGEGGVLGVVEEAGGVGGGVGGLGGFFQFIFFLAFGGWGMGIGVGWGGMMADLTLLGVHRLRRQGRRTRC